MIVLAFVFLHLVLAEYCSIIQAYVIIYQYECNIILVQWYSIT